jgi:hypothetical protein
MFTRDLMCCSACDRLFRDTASEAGWQRDGNELLCHRCVDGTSYPIWIGCLLLAAAIVIMFVAAI